MKDGTENQGISSRAGHSRLIEQSWKIHWVIRKYVQSHRFNSTSEMFQSISPISQWYHTKIISAGLVWNNADLDGLPIGLYYRHFSLNIFTQNYAVLTSCWGYAISLTWNSLTSTSFIKICMTQAHTRTQEQVQECGSQAKHTLATMLLYLAHQMSPSLWASYCTKFDKVHCDLYLTINSFSY